MWNFPYFGKIQDKKIIIFEKFFIVLKNKICIIAFSLLSFSTLLVTDNYSILRKNCKNLFERTFLIRRCKLKLKTQSSDNRVYLFFKFNKKEFRYI